jgi:hypothetical protein
MMAPAQRRPLPASEHLARTRALVVLMLGGYGVMTLWPAWWPIFSTYVVLQGCLLGYLLGPKVGWATFWAVLWLLNPITLLALEMLVPDGPWPSPWATPSYGVALALSFGLNRVMGFGGPWPMQMSQPAPGPVDALRP